MRKVGFCHLYKNSLHSKFSQDHNLHVASLYRLFPLNILFVFAVYPTLFPFPTYFCCESHPKPLPLKIIFASRHISLTLGCKLHNPLSTQSNIDLEKFLTFYLFVSIHTSFLKRPPAGDPTEKVRLQLVSGRRQAGWPSMPSPHCGGGTVQFQQCQVIVVGFIIIVLMKVDLLNSGHLFGGAAVV